jgi:Ca2+-binding EF-hand superfamily protein
MRTLIPVFVATALAITSVLADDKEKSMDREETTFKALDRDSDQRLSKSEATGDKMLTDHFGMIDSDADGYLTKREYTAHMKEMKSPKKDY